VFSQPEYVRAISKNCLQRLKRKFARTFSGCPIENVVSPSSLTKSKRSPWTEWKNNVSRMELDRTVRIARQNFPKRRRIPGRWEIQTLEETSSKTKKKRTDYSRKEKDEITFPSILSPKCLYFVTFPIKFL
jgi:hypothetical protein